MTCEHEFFNNSDNLATIAEHYCANQLEPGDIITDAIIIGYASNSEQPQDHIIIVNSGDTESLERMIYMLERAKHQIMNANTQNNEEEEGY